MTIEGSVIGTSTHRREYNIGYNTCAGCGERTPPPPQHVADDLAAKGSTASTIWPFDHWRPPGWMRLPEVGDICDSCARAVVKLLRLRKQGGIDVPIASDQRLLEENILKAIDLAADGLLTAFPPPPKMRDGAGYRYGHPTLPYVFQTYEDYRQGALRHRIRQIHNVLLGQPADDDPDTAT
jgi:hypothetical protein